MVLVEGGMGPPSCGKETRHFGTSTRHSTWHTATISRGVNDNALTRATSKRVLTKKLQLLIGGACQSKLAIYEHLEKNRDGKSSVRNRRGSSKQPLALKGWRQRCIFLCFFSCVFLCGSGISFCGTRAAFAVNLNWLAGRSGGSRT